MAQPAQPVVRRCERPTSHLRRALALLDIWRRRLRDRQALALMDDRSLRDLGLTRYDAFYEMSLELSQSPSRPLPACTVPFAAWLMLL
jgi:uncharacterized protein YjiS (DUF1127 family)